VTILQAVVLGVVQGLTEFLPVSSTAHLILLPHLLGWQLQADAVFAFDVLLQLGTLAAVLIYFHRDLIEIAAAMLQGITQRKPWQTPTARLGWLLIAGTIPAVVLGIAFKPYIEALHQQPAVVAGVLAGTAALIFGAEHWGRRERPLATLTALDALLIGAFQASALVPGVSRSAATMCGALLRGLQRPDAARFSFLLSVPVLAGAGVLAAADLAATPNVSALLLPLLIGTFTSMLVGLASIYWLLSYLQRRTLLVFGWYRIAAGLLALAVLLLRA
jgi:undecaprenyl-diphosphatase